MIVLTGASSGIGKEMLPMFCKNEHVLAITNSRSVNHENCTNISLDFCNQQDFDKLKNFSFDKKITYVGLAANTQDELLLNLGEEQFIKSLNVNVVANYRILKILLPKMIAAKWGRIIFIGSTRALRGDVGIFDYTVGKHAQLGMMNVLSKEYTRFNITSNMLSLGYFNQGLFETLSDQVASKLKAEMKKKSFCKVENIYKLITQIIDNDDMNGGLYKVDGGL